MLPEELQPNITVHGPLFPEPVQIIVSMPMGTSVKLIGKGVRSSKVYDPILNSEQLGQLKSSPAQEPFDGDAGKFRLGWKPCAWVSPTNTIPTSRFPSPASIPCRTSWRLCTIISSSSRESASCWRTILVPARRLWPAY